MKKILLFAVSILLITSVHAQSSNADANLSVSAVAPKIHRIIFQLTTNDTLAHKALMKQLGNMLSVEPSTKIEVVCHGPGLDMLVAQKTMVGEKIKLFSSKGVVFHACEFSMKERNVSKESILSEAKYVTAGILYIVGKQEEGWSYIKAGF
jgi:uncharacterized protein